MRAIPCRFMRYTYENLEWPPATFKGLPASSSERWQGTFQDAVTDLGQLAAGETCPRPYKVYWDEVAWHPSRLAAGIINATLQEDRPRTDELSEVTRVSKAILSGGGNDTDIAGLGRIIQDYGISQADAYLNIDARTLSSTRPELALKAANRLHRRLGDQTLFMITLGNGGFTAGLLTALEHQKITGRDLPLYPIRFSFHKQRDLQPQITAEETEYIAEQAANSTIVVFDEDTTSGQTICKAIKHLKGVLPDQQFVGIASSDKRHFYDDDRIGRQGKWWERC